MHQPPIVLHPFLKADEEFPEPIVPRAGAFDDPAARWIPPVPRDAFAAMAKVAGVMPIPDCCRDLRVVVPFIEAQVLRALRCRPGPPDSETVQRGRCRFHVMAVGAGHHDGQRGAALIGQRVALRAELAAVRRIGACCNPPNGALTMTLSSDCQRHWMSRSSSYRVTTWPTVARRSLSGPTLGSGGGMWSRTRIPGAAPSTGSPCGARTGCRP